MKLLQERSVKYMIRHFLGSLNQQVRCDNSHAITDTFMSVANHLLNLPGLFVHRRRSNSHFMGFVVLLLCFSVILLTKLYHLSDTYRLNTNRQYVTFRDQEVLLCSFSGDTL